MGDEVEGNCSRISIKRYDFADRPRLGSERLAAALVWHAVHRDMATLAEGTWRESSSFN